MVSRQAPASVPTADLTAYVPALRAGARALQERQRRATRMHRATDSELAGQDATRLDALARAIESHAADGHASMMSRRQQERLAR